MSTRFDINLQQLRLNLQAQKGREYTWIEIADRTDIHTSQLYRYINNDTRRVDLDTLAKLYNFFRSEGLDITIADLFTVTDDTG